MELRHLRYFSAVADELHFGRAAARLNISQPPLTKQIQNLEVEMGVQLFDRSKRQIALTPAGESFYVRAKSILEQAEQSVEMARMIANGEEESLVIGYNSAVMLAGLVPLFKQFHTLHPDYALDMKQMPADAQFRAVLTGEIDIGFVDIADAVFSKKQFEAEIEHAPAICFEMVAALPPGHGLLDKDIVSIRDLADEDFVLLRRHEYASIHDTILSFCQAHGFTAEVKVQAEQMPAVLSYVAAGFGISIVPDCSIPGWRRSVHFRRLKEQHVINTHSIVRSDNHKRGVTQFINLARTQGDDLYRRGYSELLTQ